MQIIIKNHNTLLLDEFKFKCSVGIRGITSKKKEGDKKTPRGNYSIDLVYYRKDKIPNLETILKKIPIKQNMAWCDDVTSKYYNKLIKIDKKTKHEKMFRSDGKYDLVIPINYNTKRPIKGKGSAIFIHITKNYKKTLGCIALKKKDLIIFLKIVDKNSKIKII
jgi:L,D-peptidoglycan transpeptidase YkuD (ErfK/YbiS/YcfS/YnhG family)